MTEPTVKSTPWWHFLLGGLFFLAASVGIWFYLHHLEETPGPHRIHWLLARLYDWGGKGLCAAVIAVPGVLFTAFGIGKLLARQPGAGKPAAEGGDASSIGGTGGR